MAEAEDIQPRWREWLEELFSGESDDSLIVKLEDHQFRIKAETPIDGFNEFFSTEFSTEEFDTIGGIVMNGLSHVPSHKEEVAIGEYTFKVLNADSRRVTLLHLITP